jgi:hypothetical protein
MSDVKACCPNCGTEFSHHVPFTTPPEPIPLDDTKKGYTIQFDNSNSHFFHATSWNDTPELIVFYNAHQQPLYIASKKFVQSIQIEYY